MQICVTEIPRSVVKSEFLYFFHVYLFVVRLLLVLNDFGCLVLCYYDTVDSIITIIYLVFSVKFNDSFD